MGLKFESSDFRMEDYNSAKHLFDINKEEAVPIDWELDIDVFSYLTGNNKVFMIKDGEDIVGYSIIRIVNHPHYNRLVGMQDVLYVHPDHRGIAGIKLIKFIESSLRDINVEGIIQSTTSKKDLSVLYERLGYTEIEKLYFKEI